MILGITQIIIGLMCVGFQAGNYCEHCWGYVIGHGFWCALFVSSYTRCRETLLNDVLPSFFCVVASASWQPEIDAKQQ
jgi:hypothetical protein